MNVYVVVEGEKATKRLYRRWISFANSKLNTIDYLRDLTVDCVYIFQGGGQPSYWAKVQRAVDDVNNISGFDRLVVSVDSEDLSCEDKLSEAENLVTTIGCRVDVKYIIQHFCLETWLLANRNIFKSKTHDAELKEYINRFDARTNDAELLPDYPKERLNRAQFAYRYLRAAIRDTHQGRESYSKRNPGIALNETYYRQVESRCINSNHIQSFRGFIDAFTDL